MTNICFFFLFSILILLFITQISQFIGLLLMPFVSIRVNWMEIVMHTKKKIPCPFSRNTSPMACIDVCHIGQYLST